MSHQTTISLVLISLVLSACVNTVASVATAPFKVVGKAADWATTSQSEADRNRGMRIRKAEDRARKDCKKRVDGDHAREQCVQDHLHDEGIT